MRATRWRMRACLIWRASVLQAARLAVPTRSRRQPNRTTRPQQAHKRTRSLAEKPARPTRPRATETPNKARAPSGREKTPRKPAAAAHTNGTGSYLQRNARAPAVNARRRRRRRPAARSVPQTRRPWLHRRRREPVLRTATRPCARRRALLWQWPFFAPAQSAGAACTQCRCWRAPSAGLP